MKSVPENGQSNGFMTIAVALERTAERIDHWHLLGKYWTSGLSAVTPTAVSANRRTSIPAFSFAAKQELHRHIFGMICEDQQGGRHRLHDIGFTTGKFGPVRLPRAHQPEVAFQVMTAGRWPNIPVSGAAQYPT